MSDKHKRTLIKVAEKPEEEEKVNRLISEGMQAREVFLGNRLTGLSNRYRWKLDELVTAIAVAHV
jgi:hypothetical protein